MSNALRIGYCRVSTEEQNLGRQEVLMQELGVDKLYMEKVSGKHTANRPALIEALAFVREGDIFIVSEISRLARSTRDLLEIVALLEEKKVRFISQKEGIDTETPQGKFLLTIFGALAELELNFIKQRQAEGIALAKLQGKYMGRKKIEFDRDKMASLYPMWKNGEITARAYMAELNLQPATFYRRLREFEASFEEEENTLGMEEKEEESSVIC